jgi:hypothetical protein
MIAEIMFVAVICVGQSCDFMISNNPVTENKCNAMKKQFLELPFKSEVTIAAAQCIKVERNNI